jgi:hypothetical protein
LSRGCRTKPPALTNACAITVDERGQALRVAVLVHASEARFDGAVVLGAVLVG